MARFDVDRVLSPLAPGMLLLTATIHIRVIDGHQTRWEFVGTIIVGANLSVFLHTYKCVGRLDQSQGTPAQSEQSAEADNDSLFAIFDYFRDGSDAGSHRRAPPSHDLRNHDTHSRTVQGEDSE